MEQFDREDSSTYVREPAPVAPRPDPKPMKSRTSLVLALLLVVALLGMAAFGWMWYQQNGRVDNLESDLSTARNNIAQLESTANANEKLDDSADIQAETDSDDSENDAVVAALSAYAHGQTPNSKVNVTIRKLQAPFAAASYSDGSSVAGGNGLCVMKEADDTWLVLYCAQGDSEYTQMIDSMFAVPTSIKQ